MLPSAVLKGAQSYVELRDYGGGPGFFLGRGSGPRTEVTANETQNENTIFGKPACDTTSTMFPFCDSFAVTSKKGDFKGLGLWEILNPIIFFTSSERHCHVAMIQGSP